MLAGKRLILTGLVTTDSIAYAIAEKAQRLGAEILLTALPATARSPRPPRPNCPAS